MSVFIFQIPRADIPNFDAFFSCGYLEPGIILPVRLLLYNQNSRWLFAGHPTIIERLADSLGPLRRENKLDSIPFSKAIDPGFVFKDILGKTLGFIEGLSQIQKEPERLATLADSTLRVFTDMRYMMAAQRA